MEFKHLVPSFGLCLNPAALQPPAGTELIRKVEGGEETEPCFGVTFPLLLKADGRKFGKSEDGAIWLAPGAFVAQRGRLSLNVHLQNALCQDPLARDCRSPHYIVPTVFLLRCLGISMDAAVLRCAVVCPPCSICGRGCALRMRNTNARRFTLPYLCADKLSPFKFYQYFLTSVTDGEVVRFLRMLTFMPLEVTRLPFVFMTMWL